MPDDAPLRTLQVTFAAPLLTDEPITAAASLLREGRSALHGNGRQLTASGKTACGVMVVFGRPRSSVLRFASAAPVADDKDALDVPHIAKRMPTFLQHFISQTATLFNPAGRVAAHARQTVTVYA